MFRPNVSGYATAAALAAAGCLLLALPASAKPIASVVEPIKDFGTVPKGEHIEHAFEIRNEGDQPLTLTDVRPSCGCTVTRYDKTIAPGGKGFVYADVDTISFDGVIAKTVAVYTDDPDNAKIQLVVKADVKPYIALEPGYARFNYVQGEPIGVITQTVWSPEGESFDVLDVKAPYDHIKVRYREAKGEERVQGVTGKQWKIDVEIDGDAPIGALRDYVEVTLDHPKQKKALVAISGFVRPRQHVTPAELDLGKLEVADLPREYTMTYTNFATEGIEVEQVETGLEGVEAEVKPADATGHRFQLLLRIKPGTPKGNFSSVLKIHNSDAQMPVYEVPLKLAVL